MSPLSKRGRAIVGVIIGFNLLMGLAVVALAFAKDRHDQLPRLMVNFAGNVGMAYGLWQGSRWIRGFYVLGFFLAALFCLYIPPRVPMGIMLPVAMLLGIGAASLAMSPSVNAFFAWQRGEEVEIEEWDDPEEAMEAGE